MINHLILYLLSLLSLLAVALVERTIFAFYHESLDGPLSLADIGYALLWGLRFDLAICSSLALLAYLGAYITMRLLRRSFARSLRNLTFIAAGGLLLLHGADLLYYEEAGRHLGYELLEGYNSGGELIRSAVVTYTLPFLLQLLLLLPAFFLIQALFRRAASANDVINPQRPLRGFRAEIQLLLLLPLALVMIRGGWQGVPLEPLHAQEIGDSRQATLALNGAYNALFSSIVNSYSIEPVLGAPASKEQIEILRAMYQNGANTPVAREARPYNVVMIFLESWSAAYMGSYGYDKDTTPNFDRLRRQSLTSRGMLAGGKRTTEGMFASLCSAQNPLGQTVAQNQLQNYDYRCLPRLLREQGYHASFFQGTNKNTSGTGAFAQLLGFNGSYGKEDIGDTRYPHNSWGVQDPDLYGFTLKKMRQMPRPFLVGINTNSTHDSQLPPGLERKFSSEDEHAYPELLHFSDQALMDFINAVEQDEGLGDTLFVLVADHTGITPGSNFYKYLVPFLIYGKGIVEPAFVDHVVSQRDIAPTVMDLLGRQAPPWFTGISLVGAHTPRYFADYYHAGELGWIEGDLLLSMAIRAPDQFRCYDYREDPMMHNPITCDTNAGPIAQRAMAFTQLTQNLLFGGRLAEFSQLRPQTQGARYP